jgi:prevent-host-death family protein
MKKANVTELKAKLNAYLAEVRRGTTVVVYDRATPIARLEPLNSKHDLEIIDASAPPSDLKQIKGVRPRKAVDVDRLLAELRTDR